MRIRYFGYHIIDNRTGSKHTANILSFLKKFCNLNDPEFKNSFSHNGEKVFVIKAEEPVFLFVKTKDTDIVKAIDKAEISAHEIADRLQKDESIGFASYFYVGKNYLVFGSTQLAPTVSALAQMLNSILVRLGYDSHTIEINPLSTSITRDTAIRMPFIGKSFIAVNQTSSLFNDLKDVLGIEEQASLDVGSFEITIKPIGRRNIKDAVNPVLQLDAQGMEKFDIRAKAEIHDRIMDYRIERSLTESEEIDLQSNSDIISVIKHSVESRRNLTSKVAEYERQNEIQTSNSSDFVELYTNLDWHNLVHHN